MSRTPKRGRPTGRFTQHRKLDRLVEALNVRASGFTLAELASILRASERTVRRYLVELGRQMELESIEIEPGGAHVWRIRPSERGRAVTLRRTQAQGLLATRALFEIFRGSALFDEIEGSFKDLHRVAERPVRTQRGEVATDAKLERRLFFVSGPTRNLSSRIDDVDSLILALVESRVLSFTHRSSKALMRVEPQVLYVQNGTLHLLALHERAPIALSLDEIDTVHVEPMRFEREVDADYGKWLTPLGLEREGAATHRVTLEFDRALLPIAKTLRIHPSQRFAFAADGRFRAVLTTTLIDSLAQWVLSMAPHVTVIEPKFLSERMVSSLEQTLARYRGLS
jgi:predicted DNA-binding transcriptional regulator YafY